MGGSGYAASRFPQQLLDGELCYRISVAPGRRHSGRPERMVEYQRAGDWSPLSMRSKTALIEPGSLADNWLTVVAAPSGQEGVSVVRVIGEVDSATVGRLRDHLYEYVPGPCRGVVLDFTAVSFLALCGVRLLLETADRARADGVTLRLVAQSRAVLRALQVSEVQEQVACVATVAEAVAQCSTYPRLAQ